MTKSVRPNLLFILDTLEVIQKYTPKSKEEFLRDRNAQDATLMRLQDIGEQLARIRDSFPEFYEQNQQDSWHKLIGLRNVISHGYREIEFEIIWDIISSKVSGFQRGIQEISGRIGNH